MAQKKGQRGRTDAMDVYAFVRGQILACRISPGTRLKIHELCAQHDLSNGAVREALSRLASEGLVLFEPQKGYSGDCHIAMGQARSVGGSGIFRRLRRQSAMCSSPRREVRGAFGLR
jgi:DNA-binding transcriptional MocR family regulator